MLRAFVSAALLALGCGSGQTCHGPSQDITPGRYVPAPHLTLAGMTLDATSDEAKRACESIHGNFRQPAFCRPNTGRAALMIGEPAALYAVDVGLDASGHIKRIEAVYGGEIADIAQQQKHAVQRIVTAIGEPNSGGLAWCDKQPHAICEGTDYAEWRWEGGLVKLESEARENSLELELTHSHEDMNERVIYGLPTCG